MRFLILRNCKSLLFYFANDKTLNHYCYQFIFISMKKNIVYVLLLLSICGFAQNEQLAQNYFERGDFEKALISFEELVKAQPYNAIFFQRQIECYQQLSQFDKAQKAIQNRLANYNQPALLVEMGYNYQLQKNTDKANQYYKQAIESIKKVPSNVYGIGNVFERKVLLDWALQAYQTANIAQPDLSFNFQMGLLYGQLGKTDLMIDKLLVEAQVNQQNSIMVQNQFSRFMMDDTTDSFGNALKKALLLRAQKNQDIIWNQYLSWFFVQQKEYAKAFVQEKSIYKRNPETFNNIVSLSQLAADENDTETAKEILQFVLQNTNDVDLKISSHTALLKIEIDRATDKDYAAIKTKIDNLLKEFGMGTSTLPMQILQGHFVTFKLKNPEEGQRVLKKCLSLSLNAYQEADVKMELADVFLYQEKFSQAQIYYTQIQEDLAQDAIGNEASLKAAKTSYYKGEFDWALQQFKALKSATSQLIANDALELFMLINDNKVADSTYVGLKKYARGDY